MKIAKTNCSLFQRGVKEKSTNKYVQNLASKLGVDALLRGNHEDAQTPNSFLPSFVARNWCLSFSGRSSLDFIGTLPLTFIGKCQPSLPLVCVTPQFHW